jgi:hypothetical protein
MSRAWGILKVLLSIWPLVAAAAAAISQTVVLVAAVAVVVASLPGTPLFQWPDTALWLVVVGEHLVAVLRAPFWGFLLLAVVLAELQLPMFAAVMVEQAPLVLVAELETVGLVLESFTAQVVAVVAMLLRVPLPMCVLVVLVVAVLALQYRLAQPSTTAAVVAAVERKARATTAV